MSQYVEYSEWINIANIIATFHDKKCVFDRKVKTQQQNTKSNIKIPAGAGNLTRDLSNHSRMRYLCTTTSVVQWDAYLR